MSASLRLRALLCLSLALPIAACSNSGLDSLTVTPNTQTVTLCGSGSTGFPVQFTAIGTYNHGTHVASTKDLTSLVTWSSNVPDIGTITASGVASVTSSSNGVSGSTIITASMQGFNGPVIGTATLTKTVTGSCPTDEPAHPNPAKSDSEKGN